jgi:hypothetical protein
VPAWLDWSVRVGGFVVALGLAGCFALFEAFLAPLRWGETRVPLALVAAVAGNIGLVWFTTLTTGRRLAAAGPALVWISVMFVAANRTTEGDLILTGSNWVGTSTLVVGSVAWAVAAYRVILAGVRPPRSVSTPPA